MTRSTTILLLLLAVALVAQQNTMLPKNLSLKEAKEIALQANPTLQVAAARIRAAAARLQEAQSDYYQANGVAAHAGSRRGHGETQLALQPIMQDSNSRKIFDGMARKYDNLLSNSVSISPSTTWGAGRLCAVATALPLRNSRTSECTGRPKYNQGKDTHNGNRQWVRTRSGVLN